MGGQSPKWQAVGLTAIGTGLSALLALPVIFDFASWVGTPLTPAVGQVAHFSQAEMADGLGRVTEVGVLAAAGRRTCVLDTEHMAASHGSLIVSGKSQDGGSYTVHWAGGPTSAGAQNCGHSAEVVVSRRSLIALLSAAGTGKAGSRG